MKGATNPVKHITASAAQWIFVFFLVGMAGILVPASGQTEEIDALIENLCSRDETVVTETMASVQGRSPAVIAALVTVMVGDYPDLNSPETDTHDAKASLNAHHRAKAAHVALSAYVHGLCKPGSEDDRYQAVKSLIAALDMPWPKELKHRLLRLVAFSASEGHVPDLAARIEEVEIGEMVVWTLSHLPGDAARMALENALAGASPERKVPLIQAVARYGHPHSGRVLAPFMEEGDRAVRAACLDGLTDVMGFQAAELLFGVVDRDAGEAGRNAWCNLSELADRFAEKGKTAEAREIYERIYNECHWSPVQCAALQGLARVDARAALPLLRNALFQGLPDLACAAVAAASGMDGDTGLPLLIAAVRSDQCPVRELVVRALADNSFPMSRADVVHAALVQAFDSGDLSLKLAVLDAFCALASQGHSAGMERLVELTGDKDEEICKAAFKKLNRLQGPEITMALLAALSADLQTSNRLFDERRDALPDRVVPLLEALGLRKDERAFENLTEAVRSPYPAVRVAAIRALGRLGVADGVPMLFDEILWAGEAEREEAGQALFRLDTPEATARIVELMEGAPDAARTAALRALGKRKDGTLAPCFLEALEATSVDVTVAGLDALGGLQNPAHIPDLLQVVKTGWPEEREAALRAYIQTARTVEAGDKSRALEIYTEALGLARTDDLKAMAICSLGAMGGDGMIDAVRPYLGQGNDRLRETAATAIAPEALKLAGQGAETMDRAAALLQEVVKSSDHVDYVASAAACLRAAGYEVDVPVRKGYIKRFHVLGPFSSREDLMKTDLLETDRPVDLSQPVEYKGVSHSWKFTPLDHIRGMLDLVQVMEEASDCGAYVYAEVESDSPRRVEFRIGSDDDVYCWLNANQVHCFEGGRGWQADQDSVDVTLVPGVNAILLKVLNGGGGWAVSLRIMDENGLPLDLPRKGE